MSSDKEEELETSEEAIDSGSVNDDDMCKDGERKRKGASGSSRGQQAKPIQQEPVLKQRRTQQKIKDLALNDGLHHKKSIKQLKNYWSQDIPLVTKLLKLHSVPFKICVIKEFLKNVQFIKRLCSEMSTMHWCRKQMDLYEFSQSIDLVNFDPDKYPNLSGFYKFLEQTVMPWMQQVTGVHLTRVSATCSMYSIGDHLLVHDDLLKDRKIAYVFYLTPWPMVERWTDEMGGALELFSIDEHGLPQFPIVKRIPPANNQFVFFRVCSESFHQVGEVTTVAYPRLTINGWFHGRGGDDDDLNEPVPLTIERNPPIYGNALKTDEDEVILDEWISERYLLPETKKEIQQHIEANSELSSYDFLQENIYEIMVEELRTNTALQWESVGPANYRNYEILNVTSLRGPAKDLYHLFTSRSFFNLLHEYTELDLDGDDAKQPMCTIEICRLTQGSYTILGYTGFHDTDGLDVLFYLNARDNVGVINYVNESLFPHESHTDERNDSVEENQPDEPVYESSSDDNNMGESSNEGRNEVNETGDGEDDDDDDDVDGDDVDSFDRTDDKIMDNPVLLTVVPINNSMNLVYRSKGTSRFLKYVSKKSISANEYVYLLCATYNE